MPLRRSQYPYTKLGMGEHEHQVIKITIQDGRNLQICCRFCVCFAISLPAWRRETGLTFSLCFKMHCLFQTGISYFGEESICLQLHIMSSLPPHHQNYIHCLCFPLCNKFGIKCFLWLVCIFSRFLVISIVSPFFSHENRFNYFLCCWSALLRWTELLQCSCSTTNE